MGKQAKHAAARAMLDKLDGRVPAQDGQTPLPPVQDSTNGPQAPGNTVGALQELCVKHGYPMPTYDLGGGDAGAVGGQPHQRNFSILCCVGKLRESGGGGSKKDAKREAAQKMIDKLKSMGPNNGPAQVNDVVAAGQELDEEMMSKLSNMKVETLNSGASQKVASFYRKLQTAGGTKLASLHMTSLKSRGTDFVTFLGDLGKEQKFEVNRLLVLTMLDHARHQHGDHPHPPGDLRRGGGEVRRRSHPVSCPALHTSSGGARDLYPPKNWLQYQFIRFAMELAPMGRQPTMTPQGMH